MILHVPVEKNPLKKAWESVAMRGSNESKKQLEPRQKTYYGYLGDL